MNCPRCGKPLGVGAAFCMHCGQMLGRPAPMPSGPGMTPVAAGVQIPSPVGRQKSVWGAVLLATLVLVCVLWGLTSAGALRFGNRSQLNTALGAKGGDALNQLLDAQGQGDPRRLLGAEGDQENGNVTPSQGSEQGSPMMSAQGNEGSQVLPSRTERARMPQEIYDWLRHLEAIERRKERLLSGQESRSKDMPKSFPKGGRQPTDPTDPDSVDPIGGYSVDGDFLSGVRNRISALSQDWKQLTKDFDAYPPPVECREIAMDYDQALREIGSQINDVASMLDTAMSDPFGAISRLEGFKGGSEATIDQPLDDTDRLVGEICDKYETPKWFKISSHRGGSSLLGGGFGF